jgi:hypothetical protein
MYITASSPIESASALPKKRFAMFAVSCAERIHARLCTIICPVVRGRSRRQVDSDGGGEAPTLS